jgi:hypothetical protein
MSTGSRERSLGKTKKTGIWYVHVRSRVRQFHTLCDKLTVPKHIQFQIQLWNFPHVPRCLNVYPSIYAGR